MATPRNPLFPQFLTIQEAEKLYLKRSELVPEVQKLTRILRGPPGAPGAPGKPGLPGAPGAPGSGGTPPTGTGFRHITGGAEDAAAQLVFNADVDAGAAITESKLALNFPTHANTNDPDQGVDLADSPSFAGLTVSGNVGIDNPTPPAQLTVNPTPAVASYNPANWNGTGRKLPLLVATEANNGGSVPAVAEPALVLGREGIAGQAYANFVEFNLRRYENSGTASRTGLDIAMTHGDGEVLGVNIMTLLSNGNVGIGLTLPLSPLHVKSAGFFQLTVESSASSAGINFKPSAGASVELQNSGTSVFLYDRTNSHYLMWLATNGNLGLGLDNTTPAAMLDVDGDAIISGPLTLSNTGLHLLDTNASHDLIIAPGSNITADRTLTLTTGDADRTITLTGNPTLADWFDQSVKSGASPQFAGLQVNGGSNLNGITMPDETGVVFGTAGDITNNSGVLFVNAIVDFTSTIKVNGDDGATGSFTTVDGKTVTVTNGIITTIV